MYETLTRAAAQGSIFRRYSLPVGLMLIVSLLIVQVFVLILPRLTYTPTHAMPQAVAGVSRVYTTSRSVLDDVQTTASIGGNGIPAPGNAKLDPCKK